MAKDSSMRERSTDLGVVRINNDAIATIASLAAMEVKGVYKMGGGLGKRLFDSLVKKTAPRGVSINTKESEVKMAVFVIVEYGVDIPRVADEVQDNVKRAVERMTGLVLSEVNVVVEGVHSPSTTEKR